MDRIPSSCKSLRGCAMLENSTGYDRGHERFRLGTWLAGCSSYSITVFVLLNKRDTRRGRNIFQTPMATILFIDDEDPLRKLCQTALEGAGYRVLTAESGQHGLRLFSVRRWIWPSSIFLCRAWTAWKSFDCLIRPDPPARSLRCQAAHGSGTISMRRSIWGRTTRSGSRSVCKSCWLRFIFN